MHALADMVLRYGLGFLFLNVLIEQLGAPIPAAPTLIVAGALAAEGRVSGLLALALAVAASLIGDTVWYRLGRSRGRSILKLLCRFSLSPDSCVRQTDRTFERWGASSLVVAKFVPGLSTVAPPLAGASGVGFGRFLGFSAVGAFAWAGASILVGVVFHDAIDRVLALLADLGGRASWIVLGALALYVAFKAWERRRFYVALRLARVTADELAELLKEVPPPVVLDVRSESGRRSDPRRIPGAIPLDIDRLEEEIPRLSPTREIVLYCT